jgi:TatD DNase family protein
MQFIDSHAHLSFDDRLPQLEAVLERAKESHVHQIINICTDLKGLEAGLALEKRYPWIRNAGATGPHDVDREGESAFESFALAARSRQLVAIGETGLDYYHKLSKPSRQQEFLVRYLHLAIECNLPMIIHCREAFDDLFAIMDSHYSNGAPAILHCFTGTLPEAKKGLERGWMISFSGILTFKNSEPLRDVARILPLESILIETDSPFLAPQSKRGRPNEPSFIVETAQCLADLKKIPLEEIARITTANAQRIFGLSSEAIASKVII